MLHRFRANLVFNTSSGMATWARDNLAVRYQQATHINEGLRNHEPKRNEIQDDGARQVWTCDLPLIDRAHAADAYSTIDAIWPWVRAGWIEHHACRHDETPSAPCALVSRRVAS